MELSFQSYRAELLPAILQIWNTGEFGQKFPLTTQLWRQQVERDPSVRPDDFLAAFDPANNLVGFVLTKQFRELTANPDMVAYSKLGWIAALVVGQQWRGKGVGSRLLKWGETRLQEAGLPQVAIGGNFRHFFPGVPQSLPLALDFFQHHGYNQPQTQGDGFDLRRSLTDYVPLLTVPAVANGFYYFEQGKPGEEVAILQFLHQNFPGRWRYSLALYFTQGGSPGDVILLKSRVNGGKVDKILGFLQTGHQNSSIIANSLFWHQLLGENYGGIGPLGVSSAVRGQNLGLALVDAGVNYLKSRGVTECAIDWTSSDLLNFYGKLDFGVWNIFTRLAKDL